jgi:serine/threonine protein kinase
MYLELMDCDLHQILSSKQSLGDLHFKCFTKQLLEGIKAMHSIGVFRKSYSTWSHNVESEIYALVSFCRSGLEARQPAGDKGL